MGTAIELCESCASKLRAKAKEIVVGRGGDIAELLIPPKPGVPFVLEAVDYDGEIEEVFGAMLYKSLP